jgi:hypothetical protein
MVAFFEIPNQFQRSNSAFECFTQGHLLEMCRLRRLEHRAEITQNMASPKSKSIMLPDGGGIECGVHAANS